MKDDQLIWEAYINLHKKELIEESIWSTIDDIINDILKNSHRGIQKPDIVYYLALIKLRSSNYYKEVMTSFRNFILRGEKDKTINKISRFIIFVLMNIAAFGISTAAFTALDKTLDYVKQHKQELVTFANDIESAVDKLSVELSKNNQ